MNRPVGVIIVSILNIVLALIAGFFASVIYGLSRLDSISVASQIDFMLKGVPFIISGIAMLIFAIFLYLGKNWARVGTLAISLIWIFFWLYIASKDRKLIDIIIILPALFNFFYLIFSR